MEITADKFQKVHVVTACEEWQGMPDYDLKVEGNSYEEVIAELAVIFARNYNGFPHHGTIDYSFYYKTRLQIEGNFFDFKSPKIAGEPHLYHHAVDIKKHPVYVETRASIEKAEKEEQQRRKAEYEQAEHERKLAIYHEMKAKLEKENLPKHG